MLQLSYLLKTKIFSLFLILLQGTGNGRTAFGIYEVKKTLTPVGWAAVVILLIFLTNLILGAIFLAAKILKKPKIK